MSDVLDGDGNEDDRVDEQTDKFDKVEDDVDELNGDEGAEDGESDETIPESALQISTGWIAGRSTT